MLFNIEKCKVMHLGYDNPHASYFMDGKFGNRLQEVSEERDLGVIMSEDLKSEKQCVAAVKQGNKILGMIKLNFTDRSDEMIMSLYKSLVRPHLRVLHSGMEPSLG